ncbi:MAG TPA: tRNA uridine-5-carboxymethylaminomethyl(34) synthesis GTPase MnmE [Termitinemataceae bacterium]|uniref:tRNA uridine-5-carboxymethylaminomethyl(34) synthesis GTPase MnmE n=1 Tax=Treponema sp. J25 TaxID=2094121 RepID=UPI0010483012|nr:tRNA uridine-5-carboxymethylaminomethyl(34) synthesis GTPase MnmE [Treponema sp. J25]TCW60139.1 tRNA uridine-5-carboxymethylaminomethyl(34) synthesis GTPase MnmE [Treponema sp. J25]HOK00094.1 tRNA uridine-5-carboxymethylaminomethyl(34) synthesis GTPase MnmE [Termitinemataceae bacterium]HOM24348.1 tRNA uridine-5-carboxymethylaminomethyl(34) synthesis GTPase MnmE [Termitinemataceae bacterium]HPQ01424.1 tRNA uridine-5-carboxymethylaminomethyl(34) synthesis GTPase MnmE [Termitinemataceae bacteri
MQRPTYGDEQPIAAYATPLAESALTLIRTSGKDCIRQLARVFSRPDRLQTSPGNRILHGWIQTEGGTKLDEVLLMVYRAPHSYTGEDGVDISCHGGYAAARAVMQALLSVGFREALPGEFTFRAFLHGKLDLTRAESVLEMVQARTDEARGHAVDRLLGKLEAEIRSIKETLMTALAATELFLDYSEDDGVSLIAQEGEYTMESLPELLEAAGRMPDRDAVTEARHRLADLARSYQRERLYTEGALIAIAGRPNAGKSSLFNQLVREERSIVTDIPGTTRDYIEAWIAIQGIPIRLVDTAGLRESRDPIEQIGVARSKSILQRADAVLYVLDGTVGISEEDRLFLEQYRHLAQGSQEKSVEQGGAPRDSKGQGVPLCIVWNKEDRVPFTNQKDEELRSFLGTPWESIPVCAVSALTGAGIPQLAERMVTLLGVEPKEKGNQSVGIGSARQKELIERALGAVEEALTLDSQGAPLDIIAPLLREAVDALGEITGEVSTADILETMFSRFCVGK